MSIYEVIIKESHLDTFGHVNNATYLSLYEEARWEKITQAGYGLATVQKLKKGPVILEINIQFKKELHLREKIKITTELLSYKGKISQLEQKMFKEDGSLCNVAVFTVALFDTVTRKMIEPTDEWKKAVGYQE